MFLDSIISDKTSRLQFLQCSACDRQYDKFERITFAKCDSCSGNPIIATYDLRKSKPKRIIDKKENSMWRYRSLLPLTEVKNKVSLGEGWTPILSLSTLKSKYELDWLMMKDESRNPTGSFKARGLSMAVSKAKELGIESCIIPTAGNAGGAMSAYCAKAGISSVVVMPSHTPEAFKKECLYFGAELILVDGLISDCAKKVREISKVKDCFDVSTMKEPYRLEGKKTMGYEIAEQLNWELPDVILYPTGGGTGLIGMWKAFHEMQELKWIGKKLPRMIAVQTESIRPVVNEFFGINPTEKDHVKTIANGLAVPNPFALQLMIQVIKESNGTAIAVTDREIIESLKEIAQTEGMFISPEGAALIPALKKLLKEGAITQSDKILLLNTGSAYKYLENL